MPALPRSIKLITPQGVSVTWADGHSSVYSYAYLRRHCPCAECRDHPPLITAENDPFPVIGRQPIKPVGADQVGNYAISFRWNDGHSSGIYTYEFLRGICPCPEDAEAGQEG